jgi:two-component system, LytTR family, sensor histidine kinase AlgZ
MTSSLSQIGRGGTPAYMKLALQVLADCIAVSMIVLLAVVLLPGEPSSDNLGTLFAVVWLYTIMIATPAHWILPRIYPFVVEKRPAVQWTLLIVVLAAISVAGSLVGSIMVFALELEPDLSLREIVSLSVKLSIYLALLVGIIHAVVVMLRDRLDMAEATLRAREIEYERGQKLAAEARLAALESRVHPHFFFNALNTVSSLIPTAPERAERLIERMSALLRFSLDAHQEGLVPLEQEMKIVRDYLDIEQARFGGRLRYTLDVSPEAGESDVPPLSVQTLVENSVKYAVAPARDGAEIRIRALSERDSVHIEVADTGAGFSMADITAGHGLDNLRGRLAVLFGDPEPLQVTRDDVWTTVGFRVRA